LASRRDAEGAQAFMQEHVAGSLQVLAGIDWAAIGGVD
jgi:hypothetical protein